MADDKREQRNPPGPIGRHVIENVEQLRQVRGLSYDGLSKELAKIGWPINQVSLSRMGRGERRAAADDVVAIAMVLGVNPSALMLPRNVTRADPVELTPGATRQAWIAWEWADGRGPLPAEDVQGDRFELKEGWHKDHVLNSRPAFRRFQHPAVQATEQLHVRMIMLAEGMGSPGAVRSQLERVRQEIDDLLGPPGPAAAALSGTGRLGGAVKADGDD